MKQLLLFLFVTGFYPLFAQRTIQGTILYDKELLEEVSVKINNQDSFVTSNALGEFEIQAKEGDFIYFNKQGLEEISIRVDDVTQNLTVEMSAQVLNLDEVVISKKAGDKKSFSILNKPIKFKTAFGSVSPNQGYATRYINNDQIKEAWAAGVGKDGIASFLSYRAGLRITNSFGLSTGILWDVDGFIYNELPDLDIAMIEDILVLRGVAATNLYGSQAGAGVIAIRTKNQILKEEKEVYEEVLYNTNKDYNSYSKASYISDFPESKEAIRKAIFDSASNPESLKKLAFYLDSKGHTDLAIQAYTEILMQRSSYAQSFRDLAQAYLRNNQKQMAWDTYMKYILRGKSMDRSDGIEGIVYDEIWHLNTFSKIAPSEVNFLRISDRYKETPPQPIRFVIEWINPLDAFNLSFVNPNNQKLAYEHSLSKQKKEILEEQKKGYSSVSFFLDNSLKGNWKINGAATDLSQKKVVLKITKFLDWNSKNPSQEIHYFELDPKLGTQNLLSFVVN